jgi:hypothetical protein
LKGALVPSKKLNHQLSEYRVFVDVVKVNPPGTPERGRLREAYHDAVTGFWTAIIEWFDGRHSYYRQRKSGERSSWVEAFPSFEDEPSDASTPEYYIRGFEPDS